MRVIQWIQRHRGNLAWMLAGMALLGLLQWGFGKDAARAAAAKRPSVPPVDGGPLSVRSATVQKTGVESTKCASSWTGVLAARRSVDIATVAGGIVERLQINIGSRVSSGETVASMDQTDLITDRKIAAAELTTALADERRAKVAQDASRRSHQRMRKLTKRIGVSVVSVEDVDKSQTAYAAARAAADAASSMVKERRARLEKIESAITQSKIRSPFTGTVVARFVSAGSRVQANAVLLRVATDRDMIVRFAVAEEEASLKVNTRFRACADGLGCSLVGRVSAVSPEIDPASRTIFVEGELDQQPPVGALGTVLRVGLGGAQPCAGS